MKGLVSPEAVNIVSPSSCRASLALGVRPDKSVKKLRNAVPAILASTPALAKTTIPKLTSLIPIPKRAAAGPA